MSTQTAPRRAVVLATAVLLATLPALPASATSAAACLARGGEPVFDTDGTFLSCAGGAAPAPGGGGGTGGGTPWEPPEGHVLIEWLSQGYEDGEPCRQANRDWVPEERASGILFQHQLALHRWEESIFPTIPEDCVGDPADSTPTLEQVVAIIRGQLPLPEPSLQPSDRTLPGLRTYLEIGAPVSWGPETIGVPGTPFQLTIGGDAEYRVDWGDGTVETFASSGGPYPDGDVTHVYEDAGQATVTVTPRWSVSWGLGASATMTLPPLDLDSSSITIPIEEIRAVRTR